MIDLKEFRESMNYTQPEMANLIGVSSSYYSKIELGDKSPSYNFILKFKSAFPNYDIQKFFVANRT